VQVKIWFQNRRMKWKRTKKGGKERKEGQEGEEEEAKLEMDEEEADDEEDNIQVDSPAAEAEEEPEEAPPPAAPTSPPHLQIKTEAGEPAAALHPFYMAGKLPPAFPASSYPPAFPPPFTGGTKLDGGAGFPGQLFPGGPPFPGLQPGLREVLGLPRDGRQGR
jgi:hypothetical protein